MPHLGSLLRWLATLLAATVGLALAAPASLADNSIQGTLPPAPNSGTPSQTFLTFLGPSDGSTVTLTLTYTPAGDPADALVGFNVYGEDGKLFGQSTLFASGRRAWSFQSTSVHQYTVQVASYLTTAEVHYALAAQGVSLAPQPTPTPTANPFAAAPSVAPTATPTSAPPPPLVGQAHPAVAGVLRLPGDTVLGHLLGDLTGATRDYQVAATPNGAAITLQLSAAQGALIENSLAGVNIYQMQGDVKVLIAVGLPSQADPTLSVASFSGDSHGYGDFLAEVYNWGPGAMLDYTLTRQ